MSVPANPSTAYQVIARRWRPQNFSQVVGQEAIVRSLQNALAQNRLAYGYLFIGPRGTGKTSMARIFAKTLNLQAMKASPEEVEALGQSIMQGRCLDVIEIDGASNNGVDQIRDLREQCQYAPAECPYKVYIIDEVHMLSTAAFNALLKTLEEPPAHVKFIFATTEAQKVPETITSRCQRFEFQPIPPEHIAAHLAHIAQQEGLQVSPETLLGIGRLARGGMRDAQSILEKLISFCGEKIAHSDFLTLYGVCDPAELLALGAALLAQNFRGVLEWVERFCKEGKDLRAVLADLKDHMRVALAQAVENSHRKTAYFGPQAVVGTEGLLRVLDVLHTGETQLNAGLSEKLSLEVLLLKASEQSRTYAIDTLIQEIATLSAYVNAQGRGPGPSPVGQGAGVEGVSIKSEIPAPLIASESGPCVQEPQESQTQKKSTFLNSPSEVASRPSGGNSLGGRGDARAIGGVGLSAALKQEDGLMSSQAPQADRKQILTPAEDTRLSAANNPPEEFSPSVPYSEDQPSGASAPDSKGAVEEAGLPRPPSPAFPLGTIASAPTSDAPIIAPEKEEPIPPRPIQAAAFGASAAMPGRRQPAGISVRFLSPQELEPFLKGIPQEVRHAIEGTLGGQFMGVWLPEVPVGQTL